LAKKNKYLYESAIEDFNRAIELDPKNSMAYSYRAIAKKSIGRFTEGIEDYTKQIELDPSNIAAYLSRGHARH
jgi:tetratricopeptide (TPR) repeat protein